MEPVTSSGTRGPHVGGAGQRQRPTLRGQRLPAPAAPVEATPPLVEQAGAAAGLHRDPQLEVVATLLLEEGPDLARGGVADVDAVRADLGLGAGVDLLGHRCTPQLDGVLGLATARARRRTRSMVAHRG